MAREPILTARGLVKRYGRVTALDHADFDLYPGEILAVIGDQGVDLVISDMAPNMSGMKAVDQPRAMFLVELAVDMVAKVLRPGGTFVAKVFQGEGFDALLLEVRKQFQSLAIRKPDASRARSREVYLVARGYRGGGK